MFTVLILCTGNICRSPAAEYLLRDALGPEVRVVSAGTQALAGHGIDDQMAALLPMDTTGFAARQLTADIVREADLVLAMTRDHRGLAVELHPPAIRRAFTLREFARIATMAGALEGTPGEALAELTLRAPQLRVAARATSPAEDDVADPFRQADEVFAACQAQIAESVQIIAGAVGASAHARWVQDRPPNQARPTDQARDATKASRQISEPRLFGWIRSWVSNWTSGSGAAMKA